MRPSYSNEAGDWWYFGLLRMRRRSSLTWKSIFESYKPLTNRVRGPCYKFFPVRCLLHPNGIQLESTPRSQAVHTFKVWIAKSTDHSARGT